MTAKRTFSGLQLVGLVGSLGFIWLALYAGGSVEWFINLPSMILVFGLVFFPLLAVYKADFFRFIGTALLDIVSTPTVTDDRVAEIALSGSHFSIAAGVIGTLIGVVQIFANVSDPRSIGPAMAVSMLTILYGLFMSEIVFAYIYKLHSSKPSSFSGTSKRVGVAALVVLFIGSQTSLTLWMYS